VPIPTLREIGVASPIFRRDSMSSDGEGVETGADEGAVVPDDVEGARVSLAGVEKWEEREPRERSGCVPADWEEVSARVVNAADMVRALGY
jgi:hypothetical protein